MAPSPELPGGKIDWEEVAKRPIPETDPLEPAWEILRQHCAGTPALVEYLVEYDHIQVGYCVGDVVSDIWPTEWLETHLEIDLENQHYGVFERKLAYRVESHILGFGGPIPWLMELNGKNEEDISAFHAQWLEQFTTHYGEPFSIEKWKTEIKKRAQEYFERQKARAAQRT